MDVVNVFAYRTKPLEMLYNTEQSQTAVFTVEPGYDSVRDIPHQENAHRGDQIVLVLEGKVVFRVSEEERELAAGDLLMIPAQTPHSLCNPGTEPVLAVSVYAPPSFSAEEIDQARHQMASQSR